MMIIYSKEKIKHDTDTDKLTLTQDISVAIIVCSNCNIYIRKVTLYLPCLYLLTIWYFIQ